MITYATVTTLSKELNETNDCAVKAVSIATGTSYLDTHATLKKLGRQDHESTPIDITMDAVEKLGYTYTWIEHTIKTVAGIARSPKLREGRFLVTVRGHILAVVNGKIEDWTEGRKHRIRAIYRIEPASIDDSTDTVRAIRAGIGGLAKRGRALQAKLVDLGYPAHLHIEKGGRQSPSFIRIEIDGQTAFQVNAKSKGELINWKETRNAFLENYLQAAA